jgi:hypothetical protein
MKKTYTLGGQKGENKRLDSFVLIKTPFFDFTYLLLSPKTEFGIQNQYGCVILIEIFI